MKTSTTKLINLKKKRATPLRLETVLELELRIRSSDRCEVGLLGKLPVLSLQMTC